MDKKRRKGRMGKANSDSDMLIDFSEEMDETESEAALQTVVPAREPAADFGTEEAQVEATLQSELERTNDTPGATFVELPNEGTSNIVVGTFLYTPSEEVGKELKKDRRRKRKEKRKREHVLRDTEKNFQKSISVIGQPEEQPKKRNLVGILAPLFAAFLLIGAAVGISVYESGLVYSVVRVEAGIEVNVADLLVKEDENAYFTEDSEKFDIAVPGEYYLKIHTGGFDHKCTLIVEDTTAPVVEAKDILDVEYDTTCKPEDFIRSIEDATATTVAFYAEPDYGNMEPQEVTITVTDLGRNVATVTSVLRISRVVTYLEVEAGSAPPTAGDFMISENDERGTILTDLGEIDFRKVGEYPVVIEAGGIEYNSTIAVVDTIAPVFEVKDIEGYAIVKRQAADFVVEDDNIDITEVVFSFAEEPDVTKIGTQTLTIIGTDEGGNTCERSAVLTLMEDTEPPTISGGDFVVYLGDTISYKSKVSVKDNCKEELEVKVDTSQVNTAGEGTYPVIYTATDAAGHSATLTVNMTIKKHTYDVNELNDIADGIIGRIITADMTDYDKAWAVFSYIRGHVSYISDSEKGDWVRAAYEGLNTGKGDCYVYASVSKLLLTRAGLTNMDIERIPSGNSMHYWNLVDIGDGHGWYHFDTTPRKDHPTIFLWDDATIKEYSDAHNNCHNYDRSKYPVIN